MVSYLDTSLYALARDAWQPPLVTFLVHQPPLQPYEPSPFPYLHSTNCLQALTCQALTCHVSQQKLHRCTAEEGGGVDDSLAVDDELDDEWVGRPMS